MGLNMAYIQRARGSIEERRDMGDMGLSQVAGWRSKGKIEILLCQEDWSSTSDFTTEP